jgi:hypothetical protein
VASGTAVLLSAFLKQAIMVKGRRDEGAEGQ